MQAEAVEELCRFLAMAPAHPRRFDARLKLGVAYVRLKQYDQAREAFSRIGRRPGSGVRRGLGLAGLGLFTGRARARN